jgi:transcriptional regulator GlxA family with amidase domain
MHTANSDSKAAQSARLHRVRVFIDEHMHEQLEVADLASIAGLSRFHFIRLFRIDTGESPRKYLLRARINRAKQMLMTSELAIGDVALQLGFYDNSHFANSFRRFFGISPSEFVRRQLKRGAP